MRAGSMVRDWTLALTRLVIAAIFLWHGVPKALDAGSAAEKFVGFGLPGWMGPLTGWLEVIAAPLLLIGFLHRPAAAVLGVVILGALVTVQIPGGITAGLERDALILAGLALLFAHGPGRFSVAGAEASGAPVS